jgi:hypothetical protein
MWMPYHVYVEVLLLAGVPLRHSNANIITVMDILNSRAFNLYPLTDYDTILDGIMGTKCAKEMLMLNMGIYEHNLTMRKGDQRVNPVIETAVVETLPFPRFAKDIILRCHRIPYTPCGISRRLNGCLNNDNIRLIMEILALRHTPSNMIAKQANRLAPDHHKLNANDVEAYRAYYWHGIDFLTSAINYLRLDPHNANYRHHRAALQMTDYDEMLILGLGDDQDIELANKKLFGMLALNMLDSLRNDKPIRKHIVELYGQLNRSLDERAAGSAKACIQEARQKMDKLFASVSCAPEKRLSMAEAIAHNLALDHKDDALEESESAPQNVVLK